MLQNLGSNPLGAMQMLLMPREPLRQHLAAWQAKADQRAQRLFALASVGLLAFAIVGLAAITLALAEIF